MKHNRKKLLNQIAAAHLRATPVRITHSYVHPITLKSEVIELHDGTVPTAYREKELARQLMDKLVDSNLIQYRHTYNYYTNEHLYSATLIVMRPEDIIYGREG